MVYAILNLYLEIRAKAQRINIMKLTPILVLLFVSVVVAKDKATIPQGACLAVAPAYQGCVGPVWKSHFAYVESADLPMTEIKTCYVKGDLERLEKRGVRVVVTTKESYHVRGKAAVLAPTDDSKTAGAVDETASLSAGCSK